MPGLSDFMSEEVMNYLACSLDMPVLPGGTVPTVAAGNFTNVGLWMALFTAAPTSDAGTGGTEVSTSGTNYARQQVGGVLTTNATTSTSSAVLHFASVPSWITGPLTTGVVGMQIRDITTPGAIASNTTLVSATSTSVTMSNNATGSGVGSSDIISFSVFAPATASSGNPEPTTTPGGIINNAIVTFNQSSGSWGTVIFFGLYDASTSGDYLAGDYMGLFNWLPFTMPSSSSTLTTDTSGDVPANGSSVVVTQKYGGTLPSLSGGSWSGLLTTSGASGVTFAISANTSSSTGGGMFRQVTQQIIGNNTTPSFATSQLKFTAA